MSAPCIGSDPFCPCQDGLACHYKDTADGTKGWPVPPPLLTLADEKINELWWATQWCDGELNRAREFARDVLLAAQGYK
jgi:hypothetical protein